MDVRKNSEACTKREKKNLEHEVDNDKGLTRLNGIDLMECARHSDEI